MMNIWDREIMRILLPFIIAIVVTPIIRKFALKKEFMDRSGSDPLKIHRKPVALLGGLVILIVMLTGIIAISYQLSAISEIKKILGIIAGGLLVFAVGLRDDVNGVKPIIRLLVQVLAGVVVLLAGTRVNFIPIPWIAIPLTLFYIAGAINAFNVTDGMDGLCAGISLIACVGFFILGLKDANHILIVLSSVLFMSLLGFLPYNFHPAKIFLGDAGSSLLGFLMGTMAVIATSKPFNFVNFVVPILIICVPVLDMAFAILRRIIRKRPLFIGDRDHIYDLLLKRGMSQPKVWLVMCAVQFVFIGLAVLVGAYYG